MPVKEPEDIPEQHGSVGIAEEAEDIVEIDFLEIQLRQGKQQHRRRYLVMIHVVYSHDKQGIDHHEIENLEDPEESRHVIKGDMQQAAAAAADIYQDRGQIVIRLETVLQSDVHTFDAIEDRGGIQLADAGIVADKIDVGKRIKSVQITQRCPPGKGREINNGSDQDQPGFPALQTAKGGYRTV